MRIKYIHNILVPFFLVSFLSCSQSDQSKQQPSEVIGNQDESLIKVNRYLLAKEKEDINNYIRRHGWKMQETGSGLRFEIYETTGGAQASEGKIATINYYVWLLSGKLVYSSNKSGPKTFKIGHGGVESVLEEGILYMKAGDKAHFVLPSHLAYGLLGDGELIPARMPIVYQVELIELQ